MSKIDDQIKRLELVQKNLNDFVSAEILSREREILDLNRIDQLYKSGVDSDGVVIVPEYTYVTKTIKRVKGQPTDRVTLKDTGKFYKSFRVVVRKQDFEIIARDRKTGKLKRKYGDEILGIAPSNLDVVIDLIRDGVNKRIKKAILG